MTGACLDAVISCPLLARTATNESAFCCYLMVCLEHDVRASGVPGRPDVGVLVKPRSPGVENVCVYVCVLVGEA